jgi:CheY-like chemotaxis protein
MSGVRKEGVMGKGRILVVEDDPRWQNTFRRFLESEGYSVTVASNYDEAAARLESECFHLAVIDIRLLEWDKSNEGGMQVLAKMAELGLDDITQKIVVTGYGTTELQRDAFARFGVLDFIPKEGDHKTPGFDRHEFIRLVKDAFKRVKVNLELGIELTDGLVLDDLVDELLPDVPIEQKRNELVDLLNRLFHRMSSIVISPISAGHSGSRLVEVEPYCAVRGRAQPVIVKLDTRENIQRETENFDRYVHGFVGGSRYTNKEQVCYTLRLGGIVYSLLGFAGQFMSFAKYYRTHDAAAVNTAVQNLFHETCRYWYENRLHKRKRKLSAHYRAQLNFDQSKLEKSLHEWFGRWVGQKEIQFSGLDGTFHNPVYSPYVQERSFTLPVFMAVTHGDLNGSNVLVDSNGYTWLIDFYRTGEGHILRDVIELETTVKFELLDVADLGALYELESALLAPRRFDEPLEFSNSSGNKELAKAFAVISTLRSMAHDMVRPDNDMQEYYVGLFYQTLNLLRYYWLLRREPKARRRYVLLSASMLCERLQSWR